MMVFFPLGRFPDHLVDLALLRKSAGLFGEEVGVTLLVPVVIEKIGRVGRTC